MSNVPPSSQTGEPGRTLINTIENSADGILLMDCAGTIEWANSAFTALTGHSLPELIGSNPGTWTSGWHPPNLFPEIRETMLAGRSWQGRIRNRRKDGSTYSEEITVAPIRDASGAISHFLAIQREIVARSETEQRIPGGPGIWEPGLEAARGALVSSALEEQLRRAQKMEAVGHLAGGAAHDFNNLLTVINGYSDLLLSRKESPENAQKYLQLIRDAGERATTLAARLLTFGRPMAQESRILDLNEVVTDVSTLLRRLLPANIELTHKLEPRLDPVRADAGLMEQVLMNLVVNARDAMPEGGRLDMETANVEPNAGSAGCEGMPPGRYVALTITDTGVGMDESTRERLFEPFYTTKPAGVGTGLGLSTVHRIVKQSAGWIFVQSERGKGTKVSVYLPGAQGEAAADLLQPPTTPERGSGTILLVEDNAEVLQFAADALGSIGYTILSASNGHEAAEWARNFAEPIDLMVIDLMLPDGKGRDIAERLTAIRPGLAVLFVSGYPQHPDLTVGQPLPGSGFLPKPFSADALGLSVQAALRRRYSRRILVIDDDPAIIAFTSDTLSEAGFEVRAAKNGSGAAALVREHGIELVITDIIMPESEGLETIRHLRREYPALPIIAISGAFGGQFLKPARTFGVQAAIQKPFSAEELMEVVRRTLGIGARRPGS
jgi:hypothetical protein